MPPSVGSRVFPHFAFKSTMVSQFFLSSLSLSHPPVSILPHFLVPALVIVPRCPVPFSNAIVLDQSLTLCRVAKQMFLKSLKASGPADEAAQRSDKLMNRDSACEVTAAGASFSSRSSAVKQTKELNTADRVVEIIAWPRGKIFARNAKFILYRRRNTERNRAENG